MKKNSTFRQTLSKIMATFESTDMLDKDNSSSDKEDIMAINLLRPISRHSH